MWADYCTIGLYLCFLISQSRLIPFAFGGNKFFLKEKLYSLSAPPNKPNKTITIKSHLEAVFLSDEF